ncbi:DUF72 domain-containing protein [Rubellimicrobium arenae]|uniref:DUF72 domain-containing protein n=1 Tax=Rubellimicrobium arenae TaxID=2817372 RepID=UPI001FEF4499|nr:DUF72 domain-containing protein [Rubellimicrobium arenae]
MRLQTKTPLSVTRGQDQRCWRDRGSGCLEEFRDQRSSLTMDELTNKLLGIRIGTAGWSIPKETAARFPATGTHLERYGRVFGGVEINSSFYRRHKPSTYERWARSVPDGFRFAVKVPRSITHDLRLQEPGSLLDLFAAEVAGLGPKLGPLLVQLPPSLTFEAGRSDRFFLELRSRLDGPVACEPRHRSWFTPEAEALLVRHQVARVAADPVLAPGANAPGGWPGLTYYRLHGSPRVYHSPYGEEAVRDVVTQLARRASEGSDCWCIFDNTASFAATPNALTAMEFAAGLMSGPKATSAG